MIEVSELRKQFGQKAAVDGVTFRAERGGILGLLGPNGAGKSTTMRMLAGFLPATSGKILVGGHDIALEPRAARRLMGYLPESAPSYGEMRVRGFLGFMAEARGFYGAARDRAVRVALEACFLDGVQSQGIDSLSKGYRHRVCLAQAIIHDPPILILDEPTEGLDPNQKREVRSLIRRMGKTKTILFSTHLLEEAERVCSRVLIMHKGRIAASGTPAALKARAPSAGRIFAQLAWTDETAPDFSVLDLAGQVETVASSAGSRAFHIMPRRDPQKLARDISLLCAQRGWILEALTVGEGSLEETFRELTQPPS